MKPKFKDSVGRWITVGLFEETAGPNKDFILMTIDEARKRFLETQDITGYIFAKLHLGGLQHWKALQASPVLAPLIEEWVEEMEVAKRSDALLRIEAEARGGHFQANKFLADKGWVNRPAGRPSKAEVEREMNKQTKIANNVKSFLRPVKVD